MLVSFKKSLLGPTLFLISLFFCPQSVYSEINFQSTTIEDVITLNAPKNVKVHVWSAGGAINFVAVDSDLVDDELGGTAILRYTYRDKVSLEKTLSFNEFSFEGKGFDGDVFGVPVLAKLLFHSAWYNNVRFYALGGVGIQYNDADIEANLSRADLDGKVITLPTQAAIEAANNRLIEANARVSFLSSSTSTTTGATTTTSTASATASSTIARDAALAAAESDANQAGADLIAVQRTGIRDLKDVVLPAGTKVDIDVDDALVWLLGAGVDVAVAKNILLNFEAAYHFAYFDLSGSVAVPGVGTIKIDDEEDAHALYLRAGVLVEF